MCQAFLGNFFNQLSNAVIALIVASFLELGDAANLVANEPPQVRFSDLIGLTLKALGQLSLTTTPVLIVNQ